MTNKQAQQLFPRKGQITQDIIDKAVTWDIFDCIGHHTIKESLDDEFTGVVAWGSTRGTLKMNSGDRNLRITTTQEINMTTVTEPMEVTFIVAAECHQPHFINL